MAEVEILDPAWPNHHAGEILSSVEALDEQEDNDHVSQFDGRRLSQSVDDDGGLDDDEEVDIGEDLFTWKIDHSQGEYRMNAQDLLTTVRSCQFTGTQALEMLQRRYTIDYGSRKSGGKALDLDNECHPMFFLDMFIVIGRPLMPITCVNDQFFDNITITLKNWRSCYSPKHTQGINFDIQHRTFRLATAATRESWFIVMHPKDFEITELPTSRHDARKRRARSSFKSALRVHHAEALAAYIKTIFLMPELVGEGVESSWRLDGPQAQNVTFTKWTIFQQLFMQNWVDHMVQGSCDPFWQNHQPAFHAYDYGANIQIEVNEYVQSLSPESSIRLGLEESDSESEHESSYSPRSSLFLSRRSQTSVSSEAAAVSIQESLFEDLPGTRLSPYPSAEADEGRPSGTTENPPAPGLYPAGLAQIRTELERKYVIDNIGSLSYAIAVEINCLGPSSDDNDQRPARCLLANRNALLSEYRGPRDFDFYPMAFHPAYGNFSSPRPPAFLADHVLTVAQDNMNYRNQGRDPLHFGHFQGYSNIKRSIRHGPQDLLATKGIATAALALSKAEIASSARVRRKQEHLYQQLTGASTPGDPRASKPFARESQRVQASLRSEEYGYRMEQVVAVQVSQLVDAQRTFAVVLQPLFQIMRFFLREPQSYLGLFRSFPPSIFPGVLVAYGRLFEMAIDELRHRIEATHGEGLHVALAEAVGAIDRLGNYCFTGFPRCLMGSVLKPLGTINSLRACAWPYFNPAQIDLRNASGQLKYSQWPRGSDGRPIFLHVASLSYHYGPQIGAGRSSLIWLQEMGGGGQGGLSGLSQFLEELFRDLWVPQMTAFVQYQLERAFRASDYTDALLTDDPEERSHWRHESMLKLEQWVSSPHPFLWSNYQPIIARLTGLPKSSSYISNQARRDWVHELYQMGQQTASRPGANSFVPMHATWFTVLSCVIRHPRSVPLSAEQWIGALSAAITANHIEAVPGSHNARLSHRRVIRLTGSKLTTGAMTAPAGSRLRAVIEATDRAQRVKTIQRIDFQCRIPFDRVPPFIQESFRSQLDLFKNGDQGIVEHYMIARNCLDLCVGDELCDLLFLIVLTLAQCSVTPTVLSEQHVFTVGSRKDSKIFAVTLVTRMLWFLLPDRFPWGDHSGRALSVSAMTKKLEHKGVNNRLLRELGWVRVCRGNRDNPRNSELVLQDREALLAMRKELLSLRRDASGFIRRIFRSPDEVWVDRCSSIVSHGSQVEE